MFANGKDWLIGVVVWTALAGSFAGLRLLDQWVDRRWPVPWRSLKQRLSRFSAEVRRLFNSRSDGPQSEQDGLVEIERSYVAVLVSAARSGGPLPPKREQAIWRIADRIQAANARDLRIEQLLRDPNTAPGSVGRIGHFAAGLLQSTPGLARQLAQDVLSVMFAGGKLADSDRLWLRDFSEIVPWSDAASSVAMFYYREEPVQDRQQWLKELELPGDADDDAIRVAYRSLAMQYHPDRCAELPPHIRALSEAKMAAVNEAYNRLIDSKLSLFFAEPEQRGSMAKVDATQGFICKCWMCEEKNRIRAAAELSCARCGYCSALLGLSFNPAIVTEDNRR